MRRFRIALLAGLSFGLLALQVSGKEPPANWSSWRGPGGQGYSDDARVPLRWSESENLLWKTPLPGRGNSSPIVWGNRIFLTASSPDGNERHLVCVQASDGKVLWQRLASKDVPAGKTHAWNGHASASCATDGERVYAFFGNPGLFCYDIDGKLLWQHEFGIFTSTRDWGTAASPFLFEDLVIQNCDNDGEIGLPKNQKGMKAAPMSLVALDKRTGKFRWATPRNQGKGFCTPRLITTAAGHVQLVLNGPDGLWAYEPRTGKEIWHCRRSAANDQGKFGEPMPVGESDMLIALSGRPGPMQAIRTDGQGDVSKSHVLWESVRKGRDVASPVVWENHVYAADNRGVLTCYQLKSGKIVYSQRLAPEARVLASPIALRGKLLFLLDTGKTVVIEPGPKYQTAGVNVLGDNQGLDFVASPAVADGRLFLRSQSHLYCIGDKK